MNRNFSPESYHAHESVITQEKLKEEESNAIEIVKESDYLQAIFLLRQEGALENQIARTKELYGKELASASFLTEKDWEMFSVISLYSPELAEHSIGTYKLLRSKIENISLGSESIAQAIENEHHSLDTFYRSSLFHDVGKTAIPESVLNYILVPGDWQAIKALQIQKFPQEWVCKHLGLHAGESFENFDIEIYLKKFKINPVSTLPVSHYLPEKELGKLKQRNFSTDLSLREIFEIHEPESQKILESEGLPTEAVIAGQHHNYKHTPYVYPVSSKTIGLSTSLSALLSLADKQEALVSDRPYKENFSLTKAIYIITQEAVSKDTKDQELTALWIQDDIDKESFSPKTDTDIEEFEKIKSFVKAHHPEAGKLPA